MTYINFTATSDQAVAIAKILAHYNILVAHYPPRNEYYCEVKSTTDIILVANTLAAYDIIKNGI